MSKFKQRVKRIEREFLPKHEQMIYVVQYYEDGIYVTKGNPFTDNAEDKPYTDYEKLKHDLGVKDGDIVVCLKKYGNYKQK